VARDSLQKEEDGRGEAWEVEDAVIMVEEAYLKENKDENVTKYTMEETTLLSL